MENNQQYSELGQKLCEGILLSRKKMLKEKALHDQCVVVADENGNIIEIPAKEILATHKEFQ